MRRGETPELRGSLLDPPHRGAGLIVKHPDVQVLAAQDGQNGAVTYREQREVSGAAADYRLGELTPAGQLDGLAREADHGKEAQPQDAVM